MHRLAFALALVLATLPLAPDACAQRAQDLAAKIDDLCAPLIAAEAAVGFAVGVIDGDETLVRGYGRVARGADAVPDGDTVYEIGSITKVFTSLLLADAVERGVLALDDTVQEHLPDGVAMPAFEGDPILLWHLATHSSGLPRMPPDFAPADPTNPFADYTVEKLHRTLPKVRLRDEPGAGYDYSNLGAGLLGHVVVRACGAASYEELLLARVCDPLGMRDTRIALGDAMRARLAPPHDVDGVPDHNWDLDALAGAGAIRSTVNDLLRFVRAQLAPDSTPLAAAIRRTQEKRHPGREGIAVALGWHIAKDGVTLWHNGQTGGYHGFVAVQPKTGRAVCLLTNTAAGHVDAAGERILQRLHGMEVGPLALERPVEVDRDKIERYAGQYQMNPAMKFDVEAREQGLFAKLTGQPFFRLYPRSDTEFFYRVVEASITFEIDAQGTVEALVLHQNGKDMRCEKSGERE